MDTRKFYDITHREHIICNPISEDKVARLVELLELPNNAQVVDIACGKGDFLIRLAKSHDIRGFGIDISQYYINEARTKLKAQSVGTGITFTQMSGADFKPERPHSLDLASCIGASWIYGGHANTLAALRSMVRPGGLVIVGEPYWRQEPPEDYLRALGCKHEDFGSLYSNTEAGEDLGMELIHTVVSSKDDWDRYEGLQWFATSEYARTNPNDPDLTEIVERVKRSKETYLRWGRDALGWAIFVFRVSVSNSEPIK